MAARVGQGGARRPPQEGGHPGPLSAPLGVDLGTRRGRDAVPSGSPAPGPWGRHARPHTPPHLPRRHPPGHALQYRCGVAEVARAGVAGGEHEKYHRKNSAVVGEERFFQSITNLCFTYFFKQFEVFCPLVSHAEVLLALGKKSSQREVLLSQ